MAVPETTMNENHRVSPNQYQIRVTWHVFVMETITNSRSPQSSSHQKFWTRVLATYARHDLGARKWRGLIGPAFLF